MQAIQRSGRNEATAIVRLAPGESLQLHLGDFTQAPTKIHAWRLPASGTAAGLSVGAALWAKSQDSVMRQTINQVELDQAFARQKGLALASYGLGGLALAGGLSWVFY